MTPALASALTLLVLAAADWLRMRVDVAQRRRGRKRTRHEDADQGGRGS